MPELHPILPRPSVLAVVKLVLSSFTALCLLLICFEAAAHIALPELVAASRALSVGDQRVLFISEGAFVNHSGYFNFRPNSEIREVAFYPDAKGFSLEADCTFHTDKLGFASNLISYEESDLLLLGDSFAQGSGGCAWLPRLPPATRHKLYSAAVLGTGVKHWGNILIDLKKLKTPGKIIIIFITDDFFRNDWVFDQPQLACLSDQSECNGQFWYPLSTNMAELAGHRYALRQGGAGRYGISKFWRYYFPASSALLKTLTSTTLRDSIDIITRLSLKHRLKLIWVNQKGEVAAPNGQTIQLWDKLKGFDVAKCHIPIEGFLRRDAHPNRRGYDILKNCVEDLIRDW